MKLSLQSGCVLAVLLLMLGCGDDSSSAGNSSDTPNAAMGFLHAEDGALVSGVVVRFVAVGADPRTAIAVATTTTDQNGRYFVAELDPGMYNVLGAKGDARSFTDSVAVVALDTTVCPDDTLRPVGSVCGVVKFAADTSGDIYVLALGAGVFATAGADGRFCLADLAPGTYPIRIFTSIANFSTDTTFSVVRGTTTALDDTLWVNSTELPVPSGVRLLYDTLSQSVNLSWEAADTSLVASYSVYRRNVGLNSLFTRVNVRPIAATTYRDSSGVEDSVYEYKVAAANSTGSEGARSAGLTVCIASAYSSVKVFGPEGTTGTFRNQHGVCVGLDSLVFVADNMNSKVKVFDTAGVFLYQFGEAGVGAGQFDRLWDVAVDDNGNVYTTEYERARVQKFDLLGNHIATWPILDGGAFAHLAIHGSTVYVAFVYSPKIARYSTAGDSQGELSLPTTDGGWDIAVGSAGEVLIPVYDTVFVIGSNGNVMKRVALRSTSVPSDPRGIAVDSNGNLFVCQLSSMSICVYDPSGKYLGKWGSAGSTEGKFAFFSSIAADAADNIYVSDGDMGRIQKFSGRNW